MTESRVPSSTLSHTLFAQPPEQTGLCVYFAPSVLDVDAEEIEAFVRRCAELGVYGIVPRLEPAAAPYMGMMVSTSAPAAFGERMRERTSPEEMAAEQARVDAEVLSMWRRVYALLLQNARKYCVRLAFHVEAPLERMAVRGASGREMRARMLTRREYYLDQGQHVTVPLCTKGERQAVVAVDMNDAQMIDLRDKIDDQGRVCWDVPTGDWCIHEFLCVPDLEPRVDYMSYRASMAALDAVFAMFSDIFADDDGTFAALLMANVGFHAPNRRNWTSCFNEKYTEMFGSDPAPLYSHLYDITNADTPIVKARMFACRAALLRQGIYRALEDMASRHGLRLICSANEPKLSAPSAISGDVVKNSAVCSCAVLDRAYMYGVNSLKIAAAGADNYGGAYVFGELYRDYCRRSMDVMYRDAMHAMGSGVNRLMAHIDSALLQSEQTADYVAFVARCAALLCGGNHLSDIALLYPVHSLHAAVSFYEKAAQGFEYPDPPDDTDYTALLNAISAYAGQDVTLLHPDVLCDCCTVENGALVLHRKDGSEMRFYVLVLPAARLLRTKAARLAREFYECGGKILATGETLPVRAYSRDGENEDDEVRECMRAIFGEAALDPDIVAGKLHTQNEQGGEAYWLYPGRTGADGCMMADHVTVARALRDFSMPFDVEIPTMPRFADIGALSSPYPEFAAMGLNRAIPGGGMFRYLHKRRQDCDVYYFANATDADFSGEVFLRGEHAALTLCDPHTGDVCPLAGEFVLRHGVRYTKMKLTLPSVSSCFVLSHADFGEKTGV